MITYFIISCYFSPLIVPTLSIEPYYSCKYTGRLSYAVFGIILDHHWGSWNISPIDKGTNYINVMNMSSMKLRFHIFIFKVHLVRTAQINAMDDS